MDNKETLRLETRNKLYICGVTEVLSFDESVVCLVTNEGAFTIEGQGLSITTLLIDEGKVDISGKIDSMYYSDTEKQEKKSWFRR